MRDIFAEELSLLLLRLSCLILRLLSVDTVSSRAMASSLPIPIPPRTPTPPPDDPPNVPALSEATSYEHLNTSRLSPLVDTFPPPRSPSDAGSRDRLSPTKSSFGPSPVEAVPENGLYEDGSGPFNFQTVTLAKSPVGKSVSLPMIQWEVIGGREYANDHGCNRIEHRTTSRA